jgi:hypothetical protein
MPPEGIRSSTFMVMMMVVLFENGSWVIYEMFRWIESLLR